MTPEQVQARLAFDLPPATLVLGPGAWQEVCRCARGHWMMQPGLDADRARLLRDLAWLLPPSGGERVVALCLEGASAQVQNMLLKVLEEPPESTRFVLAAEHRLLPTVVSRCRVLALGRAAEPEPADARGKAAVAAAVKLARTGQVPQLARAVRDWWKEAGPGAVPEPARLLPVWAAEAASGQWRVFEPGAVPGVSRRQALRLLAELARYPGSKLGPLVALEAAFTES